MQLLVKALAGAVVVVIIQLLSQTRNYYIAGLAPLFPTFTLIAHYIVGTERTTGELKTTIVFGLCAMIPYAAYLVALYFLVDRLDLVPAMLGATLAWLIVAIALVLIWNRLY
ncbi:MAG: GlpM family protein [Chloroflexi bacterium]|nr:GlpM family protein [Chloroflexota bacterium]MBU1751591.1 GlpM family protein [Chloroflexota bacterium]